MKPILYISHKVKGGIEKRKRNAIAFVRLFLIILSHLSFKNEKNELCIKFGDILDLIAKQSQFTLIAIAIFPLVLPIPYPPGVPSILSTPVIIFVINGLMGKKFIRIPNKIWNYQMKLETFKKIFIQSKFIIAILAKISKGGRLAFLADEEMHKIHLFFMFIMALAIVLPFPGTNYLPSISIFVIAIGIVLTDGILVIAGYLIGFFGIFVIMLFAIFGKKIVLTFIDFAEHLLY